jgi:hypothetical protein
MFCILPNWDVHITMIPFPNRPPDNTSNIQDLPTVEISFRTMPTAITVPVRRRKRITVQLPYASSLQAAPSEVPSQLKTHAQKLYPPPVTCQTCTPAPDRHTSAP